MSGCEGCFQTQKEIQKGVAIALRQAKELAVKTGENVFVYQTEEGAKYMVESAAIAQHIEPTLGILSPMRPITP